MDPVVSLERDLPNPTNPTDPTDPTDPPHPTGAQDLSANGAPEPTSTSGVGVASAGVRREPRAGTQRGARVKTAP